MHDSALNNLNILEEKRMFKDGANRICYLLACTYCREASYHPRYAILKSIKNRKTNFFCSQKCSKLFTNKTKEVECETCFIKFTKQLCQINATQHNFCSRKCSATYHNANKKSGTRRSKLEKFIEEKIKINFPNLECLYNDITTIGSELDFYFPKSKLAIQINGLLHFKPIYGDKKYHRILELDSIKRIACKDLQIKLIEINVSTDRDFNKTKDARWEEFKSFLD
jgi:hypothetical protein